MVITNKDGTQFGSRTIGPIEQGFIGYVSALSPTFGDPTGGNLLTVSGSSFFGTTFFCHFRASDHPEYVTTLSDALVFAFFIFHIPFSISSFEPLISKH